jgi:alpha-tubulin suppressor-like RCC1 family protein
MSAHRKGWAGGATGIPTLVAGISNVALVSANPNGYHSMAMTVDGGTNHYWAWGDNSYGQIGTGTNGGTTNQVSQDTPTGPLQFCTRCQREVQLGTNGTFTAHCSGTLYLYFNTDIFNYGVPGGGGSYSATILGSNSAVICSNVPVLATNYQGIAVGSVTIGNVYTFTASGDCVYDTGLNYEVNPSGIDPRTSDHVDCSTSSVYYVNMTNSICPSLQCYSLVGKIQ